MGNVNHKNPQVGGKVAKLNAIAFSTFLLLLLNDTITICNRLEVGRHQSPGKEVTPFLATCSLSKLFPRKDFPTER